MYWLWLCSLCSYVIAAHDDASTDLIVTAELAKTSDDWVVLTSGNEISIDTHLPLLLTSAKLAVGGSFDQHIVVVSHCCVDKSFQRYNAAPYRCSVQVTFSHRALNTCLRLHRWCVLDRGRHALQTSMSLDHTRDGQEHFRSEAFMQLSWRRQELTWDILHASLSVLTIDMDVVFLRNPLVPLLLDLSQSHDIVVSREFTGTDNINMGVYSVKPSIKTEAFMERYLSPSRRHEWDQAVFQDILFDANMSLTWTYFPVVQGFSLCTLTSDQASDFTSVKSLIAEFLLSVDFGTNIVFFHCACWDASKYTSFSKADLMHQWLFQAEQLRAMSAIPHHEA